MFLQKCFLQSVAQIFLNKPSVKILKSWNWGKSNNMINIAFWRSCGNRDSTISTGANRYSSWRKSVFKLAEIFGGTKLPIPLWTNSEFKL